MAKADEQNNGNTLDVPNTVSTIITVYDEKLVLRMSFLYYICDK